MPLCQRAGPGRAGPCGAERGGAGLCGGRLGLCVAGLFTSILAASTETVPPHQAPVAVSFVTLFYATGQFLGPALAGLVVEWSEGFRVAFAGSCLVMVGGVYLLACLMVFYVSVGTSSWRLALTLFFLGEYRER